MPERRILHLTGADAQTFLQGLVTNDVARLDDGLVYAAMLTPQGKYLADFFLLAVPDGVLLDVAEALADGLQARLNMYRLRADVQITPSHLSVQTGTGTPPDGAYPDPRSAALGWRRYSDAPEASDGTDWAALRVAHLIPEAGQELHPDSYILEAGFERLNGVDFRKGCYVGQEVTARMKHKTSLRKGLCRVRVAGEAQAGTDITRDGKLVGQLHTRAGDTAIAYLRFDRAEGPLRAGAAVVERMEEPA